MDVTDKFWASVSEDSETESPAAGGERERHDDSLDSRDAGHDEADAAEEQRADDAPARRRRKGKALEDPAVWARRLEQAGFSPAEAGRLIFERMRPREEGLVRT
ncbi:MAG: hypothetical protein ACRDJN_19280 [Chloroflexota bacterium]